jgi:hypothetical protein
MADFLILQDARIGTRAGPTDLKAGQIISDSVYDVADLASQGVAALTYVEATMGPVVAAFRRQAGNPAGTQGDLISLLHASGALGVPGVGSTGLVSGGGLSINTPSPPTFDVAAGFGVVTDWSNPMAPVVNVVEWPAMTGVAVAHPGVTTSSVAIDSSGALVQIPFRFTAQQRRGNIELGVLGTPGGVLLAAGNNALFLQNVAHSFVDLMDALGGALPARTNGSAGNVYSAVGGGLTVKKTGGDTFAMGRNHAVNVLAPNTVTSPAIDPIPNLIYTYRDGVGGWVTSPTNPGIIPGFYDDGSGTLQTPGPNDWTIQLIYFTADVGLHVVQYGQATYGTAAAAEAAIAAPVAINPESFGSVLRCFLVVRGAAANLALAGDASFVVANSGLFSAR